MPSGRGGGIRTRDIQLPKLALYQAEPRPGCIWKNLRFRGGFLAESGGVDGTRTRNTQIDNLVL